MKLEIKDLCFSYSKKDTIKNITFSANDGDIVAILGVNGVGKSTMLKCINKLHKPKSGEILVNDKSILDMKISEVAKLIGYVAQYGQFSDANVFENVLIGRRPYISIGLKKEDIDEVQNVLKSVHIEHLAERHVDKLSGGERQKVAIARVLVQKTPILMFDEPTSNLDLKNQIEVLDVIKNIVENNNNIALISIHDINLALRFANKFLLLKDGEVYDFGDNSIINEKSIKDVYDLNGTITYHNGRKFIVLE